MRPIKNRVHCRECGRAKMLFETEKKADTFIKFNSEDIESESGFSPNRSYYCIFCNGWHVTSKKESINIKSKTERVLEMYKQDKEKITLWREKNAEIRKTRGEELNKRLQNIEEQIKKFEANKDGKTIDNCSEFLNVILAEFEIVKSNTGSKKTFKNIGDKLNSLKKEIEAMKCGAEQKNSNIQTEKPTE